MASVQLLPPPWCFVRTPRTLLSSDLCKVSICNQFHTLKLHTLKATVKHDNNGAVESQEQAPRGRRKKHSSSSPSASTVKKSKCSTKTKEDDGASEAKPTKETPIEAEMKAENAAQLGENSSTSSDIDVKPRKVKLQDADVTVENAAEYDDEIDFPYEDPPLVCCFGAAQKEFVPTVRVWDEPADPDIYSEWKTLQWLPPDFVRAPGGPPSNVAIAHVRIGGRAAFMGKVGKDKLGTELVQLMNKEKVQTRAVKFDSNVKTACTYMRVKFEEGKMKMETVRECAEDSLLSSELNVSVLKEATHSPSSLFYI